MAENSTAATKSGFNFKKTMNKIGFSRLLIAVFWILLLVIGTFNNITLADMLSDSIRRFGMWGILVLAMVPSIQSGTGPNFALPIGIVCGLLAQVITMSWGFTGWGWVIMSTLLSIIIGGLMGYFYGVLMNAVKGSEMTIANYTGFSITAVFGIVWLLIPVKNPNMSWIMGSGLRETIQLDVFGAQHILSNVLSFEIGGVTIPTGMLLFFFLACFLVWLFFKSKMGIAISAVGGNPMFATSSGLNVDRSRVFANMLSTILGAIGIMVYAQGYGYMQLYQAPLVMGFQAVAAVLIGGATAQRSKVSHVIIGCLLFQGLMTTAMPVANRVFPAADLAEIGRIIIQNGIILYALTQVKKGGGK